MSSFIPDSILEKELLVPEPNYRKWSPNQNLLMHVASFDDWGARRDDIEVNKQDMIADGLKPRHVRLRIAIQVEYLDEPETP